MLDRRNESSKNHDAFFVKWRALVILYTNISLSYRSKQCESTFISNTTRYVKWYFFVSGYKSFALLTSVSPIRLKARRERYWNDTRGKISLSQFVIHSIYTEWPGIDPLEWEVRPRQIRPPATDGHSCRAHVCLLVFKEDSDIGENVQILTSNFQQPLL